MTKTPFKIRVDLKVDGDWQAHPIEFLEHLTTSTRGLVQELERTAVAQARSRGNSWQQIGDALGMSRQAAWEKFSGED